MIITGGEFRTCIEIHASEMTPNAESGISELAAESKIGETGDTSRPRIDCSEGNKLWRTIMRLRELLVKRSSRNCSRGVMSSLMMKLYTRNRRLC